MPDRRKSSCITFDRDIIRSKIRRLTFNGARRLQGPFYSVVLQELLEDSCLLTAKHFECLVHKEDRLISNNITNVRVSSEPDLLMTLVDNFKLAEQSMKLQKGNGTLAALRVYYHNLMLLENYRDMFDWLVGDIYEIIMHKVKMLDDEEPCFNEIKMRLFYKYGCYLESTGENLERALHYLDKAFELTKGEVWEPDSLPDSAKFKTMYEVVPQRLATVLITLARRVIQQNSEQSLEYANRAVVYLSAVSWKENKILACQTLISKVDFMIECKKFEPALSQLLKLHPFIIREVRSEFDRMKCQIFWYKGFCYYNLNDWSKAMISLHDGYKLTRKYKIRDLQAEVLLSIGRTLGQRPRKLNRAIDTYRAARHIFSELGDEKNRLKTTYLMAKLKADKLFPEFLALIKSSEYCHYYKLRQWKSLCKPFWKVGGPKSPIESVVNLSTETIIVANKQQLSSESSEVTESPDSEHEGSMEMEEAESIDSGDSDSADVVVNSRKYANKYDMYRAQQSRITRLWSDSESSEESDIKGPLDCLMNEYPDRKSIKKI